jgi:hypothetical protein
MKKVSVYFTKPQSEALDAMAAQADITFAEALRRALDEWQAFREGTPMTTASVQQTRPTVYVTVNDDGERVALTFRNADVYEDHSNGTLDVYRVKKDGSEGRSLGHFAASEILSWHIEGVNDEDE